MYTPDNRKKPNLNDAPAGKSSVVRNKRTGNYSFSYDNPVEELDELINRDPYIRNKNPNVQNRQNGNNSILHELDSYGDKKYMGRHQNAPEMSNGIHKGANYLQGNANHRGDRLKGLGFENNLNKFFGLEENPKSQNAWAPENNNPYGQNPNRQFEREDIREKLLREDFGGGYKEGNEIGFSPDIMYSKGRKKQGEGYYESGLRRADPNYKNY